MYELAIIGGGPAGYVAAQRAGQAGIKVILFEKEELGGVCLNQGCIPTKTLLNCAKIYDHARQGKAFGLRSEDIAFDFAKMMERKTRVVRRLVGGVKAKMKAACVEVIKGEAFISEQRDGEIEISCNGEKYLASKLLICTGSSTVIPPIQGLNESNAVVSSRELLALTELPNNLVIIGAGVIGMEFASLFNSLGCKVSIIEMMPKILGNMDEEISSMLQAIYSKRGVSFKLGCKVCAIEGNNVIFQGVEGQNESISADKILISVGRKANLQGFGLENTGLRCEASGIVVDKHMRTNIPNIYAAGDVTGFSLLAHTASREAEIAVYNILGKDEEMSYAAIPSVVYTSPEVAGVGLTEKDAPEAGVLKLPMAYSGRYVAENEDITGLCKILYDKASLKVLGMHMLGNPCSEIIHTGCLAIENGLNIEQLKRTIFPHPSVSEIISETLSEL